MRTVDEVDPSREAKASLASGPRSEVADEGGAE
jgi:hypothetical protein